VRKIPVDKTFHFGGLWIGDLDGNGHLHAMKISPEEYTKYKKLNPPTWGAPIIDVDSRTKSVTLGPARAYDGQ
jgi:hypothetical protein